MPQTFAETWGKLKRKVPTVEHVKEIDVNEDVKRASEYAILRDMLHELSSRETVQVCSIPQEYKYVTFVALAMMFFVAAYSGLSAMRWEARYTALIDRMLA